MGAAALAPILAAGSGAAVAAPVAATAATGAALAAPVAAGSTLFTNLALGANVLGGVASGLSAYSQGKAAEEQGKINSYIGRTRAIQTDVQARESIESELGTMRATLAQNGQKPGVGTLEVANELRRVRSRDRRIEFGNRMQEASQYRMQAQNAASEGRIGLWGGIMKAAPSVFDIMETRKRKAGG